MAEKTTRRHFLQTSSIAGLSLAFGNGHVSASPNQKVQVAVIGIRSRGRALARQFAAIPYCTVKYIVDVDRRYWKAAIHDVQSRQNHKPESVQDFRHVLDDPQLDAVVIATPDHWHAPMAIEALKAGKHVYVEKPCSHNPYEGELLVLAAAKYKKHVQMGNQRRSNALTQHMIQRLHEGVIGDIYYARTWYTNARKPIGFGKVCDVPSEFDFDLWQGPAPRTAYRSNIHPYNWHWFWLWGTGEALNNGTHFIDIARWGLNVDYPTQVASVGGRFHYHGLDDWECPDTQTISAKFGDDKMMVWDGFSCQRVTTEKTSSGVRFHGTHGAVVFVESGYVIYDEQGKEVKTVGSQDVKQESIDLMDPGLQDNHAENFLGAILGNNKLNSPIDAGHKSVLIPQLGNIALRSQSTILCNPQNGHILDNPAAEKYWKRAYESGWEPTL